MFTLVARTGKKVKGTMSLATKKFGSVSRKPERATFLVRVSDGTRASKSITAEQLKQKQTATRQAYDKLEASIETLREQDPKIKLSPPRQKMSIPIFFIRTFPSLQGELCKLPGVQSVKSAPSIAPIA